MIRRTFITALSAALATTAMVAPASADAISDFYGSRTVTVVVAAGPGGGHTKYTQFLAPYLKKHMPGNPNLIVQRNEHSQICRGLEQ